MLTKLLANTSAKILGFVLSRFFYYNVLMTSAGKHLEQWQLYVLQLENDKWYVGVTSRTPHEELARHKAGNGGAWTQESKPTKVHYAKDFGAVDEEKVREFEDRVTLKYMERYGVATVRSDNMVEASSHAKTTVAPKSNKKLVIFNKILLGLTIVLFLAVVVLAVYTFYLIPSLQTIVTQ